MSEDPFPGSSADFYEQIQILKAEVQRLKTENDSLVDQFRTIREICYAKDKLLAECVEALDGPRFDAIYQRELIKRVREVIQ